MDLYSKKRVGFVLAVLALSLFVGCERPSQPKVEDQSLFAIKEEFAAGRYDKVLSAIAQYEDSLETNSRVAAIILKAESLENIAASLNRKLPTTNKSVFIQNVQKRYSEHDIRLIKGQFYYLGRDYKRLLMTDYKDRSWVYFHKKYLELNDPFERSNLLNEAGIKNYASIVRDMIKDLGDSKTGTKKQRLDLTLTLKKALFNLSGLGGSSTSRYETDQWKEYSSDLMRIASLILSNSENRSEQLAARLIQVQVLRTKGETKKVKEIFEGIVKDYGNEKLSAFAYAWLADKYYLQGEMGKALNYYQKAARIFSDKDLLDGEMTILMPEVDDISIYRDKVRKMAGIVKTEVYYSQMLKKHRIAIIAADGVRLRKTMDPGTSKNIIITLSAGDKVIYVKRSEQKETIDGYTDYWYMVRLRNGNEGWIFGKFLLVF